MGSRIIIMAGGTGGHVFPALAVGLFLKDKGWDVSWIGTKKGMESTVIPAQNIEADWLSVGGVRGKGIVSKIQSVALLCQSFIQVFKIFRQRKPDVVIGFGGYVAGPGGLVASLLKIPLVIHEQNRVPGTTNRLLMNRAASVLEAFPESFAKNIQAKFTGNPLRNNFLDFPVQNLWTERSNRKFRILVVGGSQGAKILNDTIPLIVEQLSDVEILHQTGAAALEEVTEKYKVLSNKAQAIDFIDDISDSYQWADMIICRSGAMTVSEVAAVGLPAIFIPLPHAIDDHQTANARYLTDAGAGILLAQSNLTTDALLAAIKTVKHSLKEMSILTKNKAKLDATDCVATMCMEEVA